MLIGIADEPLVDRGYTAARINHSISFEFGAESRDDEEN
jgi:hypothetical protein